jgi:hypothetical protein
MTTQPSVTLDYYGLVTCDHTLVILIFFGTTPHVRKTLGTAL